MPRSSRRSTSRSRSTSRKPTSKKSKKAHGTLHDTPIIPLMDFLTGKEIFHLQQTSRVLHKESKKAPKKFLHDKQCMEWSKEGQRCLLKSQRSKLIAGQCVKFCGDHYMTFMKNMIQLLLEGNIVYAVEDIGDEQLICHSVNLVHIHSRDYAQLVKTDDMYEFRIFDRNDVSIDVKTYSSFDRLWKRAAKWILIEENFILSAIYHGISHRRYKSNPQYLFANVKGQRVQLLPDDVLPNGGSTSEFRFMIQEEQEETYSDV